jgi:hypothetical protein
VQATKPTASKRQRGAKVPARARLTLANLAVKGGLPRGQAFSAFAVKGVRAVRGAAVKLASAPSRYYVTIGRPRGVAKDEDRTRVAVVAKAVGGRIIDYRIYQRR